MNATQLFEQNIADAEKGNADAQVYLGYCYREGIGVARDDVEAMKWFRKAAEQNDAEAQYNLGVCYRDGLGVARDEVEAVEWFRKAEQRLGSGFNPNIRLETFAKAARREELSRQQQPPSNIPKNRVPKPPRAGAFVSGRNVVTSNPVASATGFLITQDGFSVTNEHVVRDARQICLVTNTGDVAAKVVKLDKHNDLALLKSDGWFAPLPIASSGAVQLGSTVATVGFPNIGLQGFAPKLAKGEIASLSGAGDDARYFQISVPVQPGNSGGALVDEKGNVVGIVSAKLNAAAALAASGALPENVNYAIKSSFLLSFLESAPGVEAKLKKPNAADEKFEAVVKQAQAATVLVLVY